MLLTFSDEFTVPQHHIKLKQKIKMKSEKSFFTVYACPDDWGMAQAMSSVFLTRLSIFSEKENPCVVKFFRDINAPHTHVSCQCTPYPCTA